MTIKMKSASVSTETYKVGGGFMVDIIVNKEKTPNVYEAWLYHERYGIKELMFGWCSGTYKEFVNMVKANLEDEDYIFDYYNEHMAEDAVFEMMAETEEEQKAEVFYTGGGIWIVAKYISDHVYATVDNDFDECVSYYNDTDDDGTRFGCMNLLESKSIDEMNVADRAIYNELHTALEEKINKDLPKEN